MSTNITTWPVPNLGKKGGKKDSLMGVYRFATPLGEVCLGFYQNHEATADNLCTSGDRRLLTPNEALTYSRTGVLPADFSSRPVISGAFKKDEAKTHLATLPGAREALAGLGVKSSVPQQVVEAPKATETAPAAVAKPSIDKTAIIVAALAAGKTNDEVLALIAALG